MDLSPEELKRIADFTLAHYNERADQFWEGTRDHDVSQNIEALLSAIEGPPPFDILDVGCGPGRDLMAFKSMGHRPVGLEGTPRFAQMARSHSGCEVIEQSFIYLDLPLARFDGVFANASLFHVPKQILPQVLKALFDTLRPVVCCSAPTLGAMVKRGGKTVAMVPSMTWRPGGSIWVQRALWS